MKQKNISGECIREERKRQGLTQQKLADMMQANGIRIGRDTISKIENGERIVYDFELKIFAKVLHTDTRKLLGDV